MLALQNGGHLVDPKDDLTCVADQPASLEALQWINDRALEGSYGAPEP